MRKCGFLTEIIILKLFIFCKKTSRNKFYPIFLFLRPKTILMKSTTFQFTPVFHRRRKHFVDFFQSRPVLYVEIVNLLTTPLFFLAKLFEERTVGQIFCQTPICLIFFNPNQNFLAVKNFFYFLKQKFFDSLNVLIPLDVFEVKQCLVFDTKYLTTHINKKRLILPQL